MSPDTETVDAYCRLSGRTHKKCRWKETRVTVTWCNDRQPEGSVYNYVCAPFRGRPLEEAENACSLIISQLVFLCVNLRVGTMIQRKQAGSQDLAGSSQGWGEGSLPPGFYMMFTFSWVNLPRVTDITALGFLTPACYILEHGYIRMEGKTYISFSRYGAWLQQMTSLPLKRPIWPLQCSLRLQVNASIQPDLLNIQGRPQIVSRASVKVEEYSVAILLLIAAFPFFFFPLSLFKNFSTTMTNNLAE